MKVAALILALMASSSNAKREPKQHGRILGEVYDVEEEFAHFKKMFHKNYASVEEEAEKKKIFEENLEVAAQRNKDQVASGGKHVHGVTKFSDMSYDQFNAANKGRKGVDPLPHKDVPVKFAKKTTTDFVDWTADGYVTAVKNQGQCGSCWAQSATEAIESMYMLSGNAMWDLSAQQVTSCTASMLGCGGGDTTYAYQQLIDDATKFGAETFGLSSEAETPYLQSMYDSCLSRVCTTTCADLPFNRGIGNLTEMGPEVSLTGPYVPITGYSYATPTCTGACDNQDLDTLNANVASTGPPSICVNAASWNSYVGGVMTTAACGGYAMNDIDHCVQLTGYNLTAAEPYYMVRNSWATNWGVDGYIMLSSEGNTCGLANEATFPDIAEMDF